jgi:hypothetical protein
MMDNIFADVPYVFVYLDDVLVASRSEPNTASMSDTCYTS